METSIRIELSQVVDGDLGRLAKLLTSPEAWSLWPGAPFTFAVARATQPLRLYIGPTPSGVGSVLYEIAEVPGESIRLRTLPTGRQEFTLSARAGRRGTAKASVQVRERVPRKHEVGYEIRRRKEIKSWLSEVRSVIEGRTPWPRADMGLELQERCKARPPMDDADSTSASAVINAEPAAVWDVVQSPESACSLGAWPAIHSGYVPSTPRDEPGEMQYFISLRSDGQLTAEVVVVSELSERHSAVTHFLRGAPQLEQSYLLVPESEAGPTRLDLTCRWPASKLGDNREAVRGRMAEAMHQLATGYKSLIENAGDEA